MKNSPLSKPLFWQVLSAVLAVLVLIFGLRSPQSKVIEKTVEVPIEKEVIKEVEVERIVEIERPPPPEQTIGIARDADLTKTNKGFSFSSRLEVANGDLATVERKQKSSYKSEHVLTVKVPRAAATMAELEIGTPNLSKLLPGLTPIVANASVSDFFEELYRRKTDRLRKDSAKLGELLTSHNFFDCQTMLNLTAEDGQKIFLMQGDMDVVSDGSDGDRLPEMPDKIVNSSYYQPTTSYGWAKVGKTPNPLIKGFERRLNVARAELRDSNVSKDRKDWVRGRIDKLIIPTIEEMRRRSFLIADHDPFIVIPTNIIVDRQDPWGPKVGDYAVVIHEGKVYPAICGDAGPTFKVGEASLRMARQIDSRSSSYRRPVSSLTVTYLCFPKTAKKPHRPPNYEEWHQSCSQLLGKIGGLQGGAELFEWESTLPNLEPEEPVSETPEAPES